MIKKFEFNTIYVFESLTEKDMQTGSILYEDLLKRLPYKITFLKSEIIRIDSKIALFQELEKIKRLVIQGNHYPFFHFEIHGSVEGLVLNSNELVTWLELTNRLREINIQLNNNLFVSLATCYGAHIYLEVKPFLPSPFFAFIGPWEKVTQGDIMQSFYLFFECMLNTANLPKINFQEAVKKLNENQTQTIYHFYNSEGIFDRVMADYDNNLADVAKTNERIEYLIEESRKDTNVRKNIPLPELKKLITHLLIDNNEATKAEYKKQFLML